MKGISMSFKRDFILIASMFVMLGILFLVYPDSSGRIICYILGGMLCLVGLLRVIEYFRMPVSLENYNLSLVFGLITIGLGAYILISPELLMKVLPTVFGISVILDSLVKLQNALDMLRLKDRFWWITLIVAFITAGLGAVLLANPFKAMEALLQFVGISLIATGVLDLVALFTLSSRISRNAKAQADWLNKLKMQQEAEAED